MPRRPATESELFTATLHWLLYPWAGPEHPPRGAPDLLDPGFSFTAGGPSWFLLLATQEP